MAEVISVRFRGGAKNYYFDPRGLQVEPEQYVVVETAQGIEYVKCVEGNHQVDDESVVQPLRPVVRIATDNDHKAAAYKPPPGEGGLRHLREEDRRPQAGDEAGERGVQLRGQQDHLLFHRRGPGGLP